jgi:SAM-dependent methyltransferase
MENSENKTLYTNPEFYDLLAKRMIAYDQVAGLCKKKIDSYYPAATSVLDLACGTGNLTLELAKLGYTVQGLDASAELLRLAVQKTAVASLPIHYLQHDMSEPYPVEPVEVMICFYTALNYLTSLELLQKCFECVAASLKPGGLFMFDQFTPAKMRRLFTGMDGGDVDNLFVVTKADFDEAGQILNEVTYFQLEANGYYSRYEEKHYMRIHSFEEIEAALSQAGLRLLEKLEMYPAELSYRGFREGFWFVAQK